MLRIEIRSEKSIPLEAEFIMKEKWKFYFSTIIYVYKILYNILYCSY